MSDVKLEVGQIWESETGYVRKIVAIGELKVFYQELSTRGEVYSEPTCVPDYFIHEYAYKLLPCWPPEPELKEITAGFHASVGVDKDGNIVISKGTLDSLIAGYKACMGVKDALEE